MAAPAPPSFTRFQAADSPSVVYTKLSRRSDDMDESIASESSIP